MQQKRNDRERERAKEMGRERVSENEKSRLNVSDVDS